MDNIEPIPELKKVSKPIKPIALKKVDPDTARTIQQIKDRANKKPYGRKVKDSDVLGLAVSLLTPEHIPKLQALTYTERDQLRMSHDEYQKKHGKISLDQFIGKLIRGEIAPKN